MTHSVSDYINDILQPDLQSQIVTKCCSFITKHFPETDYIVVRGVSGLVIGSVVAHRLKKRLVVVRKQSDSSHAEHHAEGFPLAKNMRFIILDDFVSSGLTLCMIADGLRVESRKKLTKLNCLGYLMYLQNHDMLGKHRLPFKNKPFQYFRIEA